jgi:methylase of polypeptide subunit release factors
MDHPALLRLGHYLRRAGYVFVTISPASHRRVNGRPGNELASDLRGVFGWNRPFKTDLLAPATLEAMQEADLLDPSPEGYKSRLRAATLGGQLYFHSAFPTHDTNAVFFGPDTYRYAQVLRAALATHAPLQRAVDIGCGAGPGALCIAALFPDAEVWATDINPTALELARLNVQLAGLANVHVARSDLMRDVAGQFDLIAANPPFMLDTKERTYCHGGGELGEGLSNDIVDVALTRLAPGGMLVLYTCVAIVDGVDLFRERCAALLDAAGFDWQYREIDPDVFGGELGGAEHRHTDRIAAVALTATRRSI